MKKILSAFLLTLLLLFVSASSPTNQVQAQGASGDGCTGVSSNMDGTCRLIVGQTCDGTRDSDCNFWNSCCVPCGAPGQQCCQGSLSQCQGANTCINGVCSCIGAGSGLVGSCVGTLAYCDGTNDGSCRFGSECCIPCGRPTQPCCPSPVQQCRSGSSCDGITNQCISNAIGHNEVTCTAECQNIDINCYPGYRLPDPCVNLVGDEIAYCCARLGHQYSGGGTCQRSYDCVLDSVPTPTPTPTLPPGTTATPTPSPTPTPTLPPGTTATPTTVPPTPTPAWLTCEQQGFGNGNWTCELVPYDVDCSQIYRGSTTDCLRTNGTHGTCCYPPPGSQDYCSANNGVCIAGACPWPYRDESILYPCSQTGDLCCMPTSYVSCAAEGGYCASSCGSGNRTLTGNNDCQNPQAYPPNGQQCCIPVAGYTGDSDPTCTVDIGTGTVTGIDSAIGCIPVENIQALTAFLLSWGLGIAAGIALLLIAYAGFIIMTSQGNPQRLQAGKELLTAALSGLLLIVFSATILRLIGVEILGIPGFG